MKQSPFVPPLLLVDGSSYLFRAFHALPALHNAQGMATGAIYGVINMLRRLLADYQPTHIAMIFDAPGTTFRHQRYPDYKAQRSATPPELKVQVPPLLQLIEALGVPLLQIPDVEADDVIGTLAQQATARGWPVVISTGDKDLTQLVNDQVTLINTMSDTTLDRDGVVAKFGVAPEQMIDFLALVGDKVDNIPGIPGCGPKTAAKWLNAHGSLAQLLAAADTIRGKIGETLRAHRDQLPLAQELVTIRCDLSLPLNLDQLVITDPDEATLQQLFAELGFRSWLAERLAPGGSVVRSDAPQPTATPTPADDQAHAAHAAIAAAARHYQLILEPDTLQQWLTRLQQSAIIAIDTETTSLNYMQAELVGISFAVAPGEAAYLPLAHNALGAPSQLPFDHTLAQLRPLLEASHPTKVGHNLKYDCSIFARYGITLGGIADDTMLQAYLLNSSANRHDLDTLTLQQLGHRNITFEEVAGKGAKQIPFNQVALAQALDYAAEDADMTLRLQQVLTPQLAAAPRLATLYRELELPLLSVLSQMERTGVLVDAQLLRQQSRELAEQIAHLEQQAHTLAGQRFNLASTKQLQHILFEQLALPVTKRTPKGQPSTAEEVLQALALEGHELPQLLIQHRTLSKLRTTYTDRLPAQIDHDTGRLHTSYHQAVTATGRLSSSDPNLQNIPIRTAEGRRIRQAFIAPPDQRLIAADYSQIELRLIAHLSEDEGLLAAFAAGEDIHRATAAELFGIAAAAVDSEQRRRAKAINFGLIYGMSAFGLAQQLGIDRGEAQRYIDRYFSRYPRVLDYMERTREQAREQGYVETLYGRRVHLPEIHAGNRQRRLAAERAAINAPLQGSAADIIKRAMLAVASWIARDAPPARLIMQVHDELVLEVATPAAAEVANRVATEMSGVADLRVPLEVAVGIGENWDQAH